jgi:16S rRNA (cytidine1402-2'-O)-methyltransferase
MPGTLYLVATPIGNLEDITLRALRTLREVRLIAAEDTRRTAKLLAHYEISTPTTSYHEHNEDRKLPQLLGRLEAGEDVAVVTDAGTPGVSDPGQRLAATAQDRGLRVVAIPGPSAVLAALLSSGFPTDTFTFLGFPPNRSNARKRWLERWKHETHTLILFEAPHRITQTLQEARDIWGERQIAVVRELTKVHEELVKGPISDVLASLGEPRGEYTIVAAPAVAEPEGLEPLTDAKLRHDFGLLTKSSGLSRREAITELSNRHHLRARDVYAALERTKT